MTDDLDVVTPAEAFYAVLDKYEYKGVEPIENWSTEDLISLQEAIRAELQERDSIAQEEYFEQTAGYFDTASDGDGDHDDYQKCGDRNCTICYFEGSYGGTD